MDEIFLHSNPLNSVNYPEPDITADEGWQKMQLLMQNTPGNLKPGKIGKSFLSRVYIVVAAVGLILLSIVAYKLFQGKAVRQNNEINYNTGSSPMLDTLRNGTIAFLNNYTRVNEVISKNSPHLLNIYGAAYFPENQNSRNLDYHLRAGSLLITPLKAVYYVSFDSIRAISCVHVLLGSVEIEAAGKKLLLNAGESIAFDETSKRLKDKAHIDVNLFSYATKTFEFSDTPLLDAAGVIGKAYGVTIVFENNKLYNCRITTRFDNKTLRDVLDIMGYTLDFKYSLDEKNKRVLLTGNGCE